MLLLIMFGKYEQDLAEILHIKMYFTYQVILEKGETETRQRLNNQIEKLEREIAQLKKKLENEVEQRHTLSKNQDVSIRN